MQELINKQARCVLRTNKAHQRIDAVEKRTIVVEYKDANGKTERIREYAPADEVTYAVYDSAIKAEDTEKALGVNHAEITAKIEKLTWRKNLQAVAKKHGRVINQKHLTDNAFGRDASEVYRNSDN